MYQQFDFDKHSEKIGLYYGKNGGQVFVAKASLYDGSTHYFIDYFVQRDFDGLMNGHGKDFFALQHIDGYASSWYRRIKKVQTHDGIIFNKRGNNLKRRSLM